VRITWPHHELAGAELEVHGWLHIGDEIHLRVTLLDGSVACLPAAWTNLFEVPEAEAPPLLLSPASVRALRAVLEPLASRRRGRKRRREK
jgi:hypothetical protein